MNEKEAPHANPSFFPEKIIGMPGIVAPTTELPRDQDGRASIMMVKIKAGINLLILGISLKLFCYHLLQIR